MAQRSRELRGTAAGLRSGRPGATRAGSRAAARGSAWAAVALVVVVGCARPEQQQIHDSLEPMNRPIFAVNKGLDDYAIGPVARGYKAITPSILRRSLTDAQRNLQFPARLVSILGRGEFEEAGTELARFLLNSTVGVAGLWDPASRIGLAKYDSDIGMMFASWRIPPGPYIVIPVLGPSTARDAIGDLFGAALNPLLWTGVSIPPIGILFALNKRAESDDQIKAAQKAALDYYLFVRDAYIQRRTEQIRSEYVTVPRPGEVQPDLYAAPADLYEVPDETQTGAVEPAGSRPGGSEDAGPLAPAPCPSSAPGTAPPLGGFARSDRC
jgi:phospholipid-binding lipoprotein MlaA